jgi:hypothetical protein
MSTYTQVYYHIVFSTKERAPVLAQSCRESLFRYAWGVIQKRRSRSDEMDVLFHGLKPHGYSWCALPGATGSYFS